MISGLSAAESWFATGGLLLALAYLIRVREWTFLIAGYDASVDIPEVIAANIVGNFLARAGIAALAIGIVAVTTTVDMNTIGLMFAVLLVIDLLRVVYRLNTYEESNPTPL